MACANFFWHGDVLSFYTFTCLTSFLQHGFIVKIYSYNRHLVIPEGAQLLDATDIMGHENVLAYTQDGKKGSIAAFADIYSDIRFFPGKLVGGSTQMCYASRPHPSLMNYPANAPDL